MINSSTLQGWEVVVLRPLQANETLSEKIHEAKGEVCLLPMIEIVPLTIPPRELKQWCERALKLDYLFVVSGNAVQCAPESLLEAFHLNSALKVVSMGESTSQALMAHNIPVGFTPEIGTTSESLLEKSLFQSKEMVGKSIGILAGEAGRTVLAETLQSRGAVVMWFPVYRQRLPQISLNAYFQKWQQEKLRKIFIATSANTLQNLMQLTPTYERNWLFAQPVIVVSERIAESAKQFGFQQVFIAKGAQENSLMMALYETVKICHTA
jgi:uroporphyrinogen-III synthase